MNFEEAVMPHLDAAYNLARWLMRNEDDAQDMVQEAYLRALRFFGSFHGTDARPWLLTIVRNTCFTWLKRNRLTEIRDDFDEVVETKQSDAPDPEASHVSKVQSQLLREAIEKLPIEFREVVILRELEELSYKEIAAITGIPIGTVMSRLSRARTRLRGITESPARYVEQRRFKASIDSERRVVMKRVAAKRFANVGLLVVMMIVAASASANAQSLTYKLTANIPFDFTVADKKLPAGKYWISRGQQTTGDLILQIRSVDGDASVSRLTIPVVAIKPVAKGMLVFHRYGDEYFLSEVWPAGGLTGRELPKSHAERELERKTQEIAAVKITIGASALR